MKKILNISILTAFALLFSLSGCVSDNIVPDPYNNNTGSGEASGLIIRFGNESTTRGTTAQGETLVFNEGYLLVVSGATISRVYEIHNDTGRGTNPADGYLYIEDLKDATEVVILPAISGATSHLVVVGNTPLSPVPAAGMNIGQIREQLINVLTQHDRDDLNLWGISLRTTWTPPSGSTTYYMANIDVFPTVARIEMQQIDTHPDSEIHSFTVEAIFIDRHYNNAQVGGAIPNTGAAPVPTNFVSRGDGTTPDFGFAPGQFGYEAITTNRGALFNIIDQPSTTRVTDGDAAATLALADPNRWAYHLFAMQNTATSTGTQVPSIVIRLSNVRLRDGSAAGIPLPLPSGYDYHYLTIQRFIVDSNPLAGIHALNIYHIGSLLFHERYLGLYPNENPFDANVRVTLAHWYKQEISVCSFHQPNPIGFEVNTNTGFTINLAPAIRNGSSAGLEYMWQREVCTTPYVCEWVNIGSWTTVHNLTVTGGISEDTRFRRIARVVSATPAIMITSAPARVVVICPCSDGVLINGTVWARCNVGAPGTFVSSPTDRGMLFQWNSDIGWSYTHPAAGGSPNYRWDPAAAGGSGAWVDNYPNLWSPSSVTAGLTWNPLPSGYNRGPCPSGWRLPTNAEFVALVNAHPFGTFVTSMPNANVVLNGGWVNRGQWMPPATTGPFAGELGVVYGDPAGAHVFLPAAGWRTTNGMLDRQDMFGLYWSGVASSEPLARFLQFAGGTGSTVTSSAGPASAFSVRCVAE